MLGEETSAAARSLRKAEWLVLCHVGQIEDSIVGVTGKKAVSPRDELASNRTGPFCGVLGSLSWVCANLGQRVTGQGWCERDRVTSEVPSKSEQLHLPLTDVGCGPQGDRAGGSGGRMSVLRGLVYTGWIEAAIPFPGLLGKKRATVLLRCNP